MAIAFVNGAVSTSASFVLTASTTYAPTAGHIVGIALNNDAPVTGTSIVDSNGVTMTAGPSASNGTTSALQMFYYICPASAPASFTANWTTSAGFCMLVGEWSGALGGVNPVGIATTSSGAAQSITLTSTGANSFIVGAIGTIVASNSPVTGNSRETNSAGPIRTRLLDNTSAASASALTIATSSSSVSWTAAGIELLLSPASGGAGSVNSWIDKAKAGGLNKHN